MATPDPASALVKRSANDVALMPPPPLKRIKRPPKVLDEDEYTSTLSDIIARDYFPGLRESRAQQEYLSALESNNEAWIVDAGHKLREAMTPLPKGKLRRSARNTRFDTSSRPGNMTPVADTPRGYTGNDSPISVAVTEDGARESKNPDLDTSALSLSGFQAKYTSEDNESFNTLLDKQNEKRREKHAYLWTPDQRIPTARQIAFRAREARLLQQREDDQASGKALVAMTSGATDSRPAKPDSWTIQKPDNNFMFQPNSIDEDGLPTVAEMREASSKAAPKQVIHSNTRFPPLLYIDDPGPVPPSPSLNTQIIANRETIPAGQSSSVSDFPTGDTPRVNGYAYVDEDEPSALPPEPASGPTYRDLLAGQVGDSTPNPFQLNGLRKREDLHHRMVEKTAKQKRVKGRETMRTPLPVSVSGTPVAGQPGNATRDNMTPAARKLIEKLGRTPVAAQLGKAERMSSEEMWTPTPRRKVGAK